MSLENLTVRLSESLPMIPDSLTMIPECLTMLSKSQTMIPDSLKALSNQKHSQIVNGSFTKLRHSQTFCQCIQTNGKLC